MAYGGIISVPRLHITAALLLTVLQHAVALELGQSCVNPSGESGSCILFRECQPLVDIFKKPFNTPDDTEFLQASRCGDLQGKPLVCCAGVVVEERTTLPEPPNCGTQLSDRIYGGQPTKIDEFPWTALIEYEKPNGRYGFHCGGSLINRAHIVTAAHCINAIPRGWKVHRVRLGEWDLSTSSDCEDDFCSTSPIDLNIAEIIVHSGYNVQDKSHVNDIALIRFTRHVEYTELVRPICLPLADTVRNKNYVGVSSYAAGWGKTEVASASEKKLKVELNIVALDSCSSVYKRNGINLQPSQLCAGGVRGSDTCSGDSGGPLMKQYAGAWYLLGIVSFGPQKCGTAGVPGVYTNVREYTDWIRSNINKVFLLMCLVAIGGQSVLCLDLGQSCINPRGQQGSCIQFQECQPLVSIYNKPVRTDDDKQFLLASRCGTFNTKTLVCCVGAASSGGRNSLPQPPNCGIQLTDRVVGGQPTKIDEFPWTALIEFQKADGRSGFHCGGSLINPTHIVTAAHCINAIPRSWKPHRIRLGEWDLGSNSDCLDDFCAPQPVDLEIEKIIVHPGYDSRDKANLNDIALIRFKRDVQYSDVIRPICLPLSPSVRNRNYVGASSYAAGWGKTETASASDKKLKVELNIKSQEECAPIFARGGIFLKPSQICAGGVRGKDTCSGDSGGPLMRQVSGTWYLLGVVSFGPQKCGTAGVPGVYTNVMEYTDWIKNNIE
ncbi:uncharacterized protein LOC125950324 [Anopheles darlingi]|uniref:uncharacterized protein LOC125950324 n=1 Tax=Anopheles darlingi TaxID=43151 RepID=UPI0021000B9E|nr:uncharacterized protein LOC125950324 [Anopheles darlingi]